MTTTASRFFMFSGNKSLWRTVRLFLSVIWESYRLAARSVRCQALQSPAAKMAWGFRLRRLSRIRSRTCNQIVMSKRQ
jgi:hypothetical protein